LISVACPWDKTAPKYQSQENFSLKQAAELLSVEPQALTAMKLISQTPGGRVGELQIGDKKLAGVDIRRQLGLNSAAFTWQAERDKISFSVLGYGHGVGMCQYGARGMALKGYTYQEILAHYYQGTKIEKIY
ncbi:MAG: stage II sporulation protein D, partial [Clostridiales bacterium]